MLLRHVTANNYSLPQGDCWHKEAFDAETCCHQLYLASGTLQVSVQERVSVLISYAFRLELPGICLWQFVCIPLQPYM